MKKEFVDLKNVLVNLGHKKNLNSEEEIFNSAREAIIFYDLEYRKGKPIITDTEFDTLYLLFEEIEEKYVEYNRPDSPTKVIFDVSVDELEQVKHETFMGSQDKANSIEDIEKFINKVNDDIIVEYKLDGITIVLRYKNGLLDKAITRGNGYIGYDITHSVKNFLNIPNKINYKEDLEIRAEGLITYNNFEKINNMLDPNDKYSNPRNLVAGTVRNLDSKITAQRGLIALGFDITKSNLNFKTGQEEMEFLKSLHFPVVNYKVFNKNKKDELIKYCSEFAKKERNNIPYMIDGLVLKANNIERRLELGEKTKFPNWSIAYKFESLDARSKLIDVVWQTGKTGRLAPVGIIDEVIIDNIKINRVTLNNIDWINEMNLKLNSEIMIARANDVIPKIIDVIDDKGQEITIPKVCNSCGGPIIKEGAHLFCNNESCPEQVVEKIASWCSKDRMDIPGLGIKAITQLYNANIVTSIPDLYNLKNKKEEFLKLERQGEKSFKNAINSIEKSKNKDFYYIIYGLNISNLGSTASKTFVKRFKSYNNIKEEMKDIEKFKEKILELDDMGEVIANSIINFFNNKKNIELLDKLSKLGLNMTTNISDAKPQDSPILNKTFVLTGTLSKSRKDVKSEIEALGGKVTGSVSKNTDYLLAGEKAGSKKTQAEKLGIKILNEKDFYNLIKA